MHFEVNQDVFPHQSKVSCFSHVQDNQINMYFVQKQDTNTVYSNSVTLIFKFRNFRTQMLVFPLQISQSLRPMSSSHPTKSGPTSSLLRWGRRSFILTLIRWGFMNSVRTEPRMSFLPYSTRLSSPALKMRQTLSFSK
jgi:hypothetical protein